MLDGKFYFISYNKTQLYVRRGNSFCAAVFGGVTVAAERRRRKELMERMLDAAEKGTALSECFDEGRMSALETRFMDFCRSSAVSAEQIKVEKDRIKELIGDISHQTKTPVANLLLYSELLNEQELPEETHEMTKALHGQTEKLHFLIDSLVKLSRLENGILTLHPQKEPLASMRSGRWRHWGIWWTTL